MMQENIIKYDIFQEGIFGKIVTVDKSHMDRYLYLKKIEKKYLEHTVLPNPLSEIFALKTLRKIKHSTDAIPELERYNIDKVKLTCEIYTKQIKIDTLDDYFDLFSITMSKKCILQTNNTVSDDLKYSIIIRMLSAIYSINNLSNIYHNNINGQNIIISTCEYDKIAIKYIHNDEENTMILNTHGFKPMICDFDHATYSKQHKDCDYKNMSKLISPTCDDTILNTMSSYYNHLYYNHLPKLDLQNINKEFILQNFTHEHCLIS